MLLCFAVFVFFLIFLVVFNLSVVRSRINLFIRLSWVLSASDESKSLRYLILSWCLLYICLDYNATASTTSVKCSPRWSVYPESHSLGAGRNESVTSQQQCLQTCIANASCVAVEWNYYDQQCWVHDRRRRGRRRREGITTFIPNGRCADTTGNKITI